MRSANPPRLRLPKLIPVALAGIAIAVGLRVHTLPRLPVWTWFLAAPALVALAFLIGRGPRWCLAALIVTDVLGFYSDSVSVATIDVRVTDIFWVALVGWVVHLRAHEGLVPRRRVGQVQIALWLIAIGVSLIPLVVRSPGDATESLVAWLRLVQTLSLIWLVPYAARRMVDREFVLRVVIAVITAELVRAIIDAGIQSSFGQRLVGANGPNTTGLLAAILIVLAVHSPIPRRGWMRGTMLVIGIAGVVLSQSLGSTVAVAATLGIFGLRSVARGQQRGAGFLTPARVLLLALAAVGVAAMIRPANLPDSSEFAHSTTTHRAVLAVAGLELFLEHPVTGVGWQQAPAVIGSEAIDEQLRKTFSDDVNPAFFPAANPTSVHNMYVQMLAEAGIVGFTFFVVAFVAVARGILRTLRGLRGQPELALARSIAAALVVIVVWWNDNPLFGVQPETVLAAVFIGLIASIGAPSVLDKRVRHEFSDRRVVRRTS